MRSGKMHRYMYCYFTTLPVRLSIPFAKKPANGTSCTNFLAVSCRKSEQLLKFSPLFSAKPDTASNAAALPNKNLQLRCRKSFGNLLTFFRKQCKIKELYITNPVADAVRKMASVFYWNCGVQLSEYRGSAQTSRRFFFLHQRKLLLSEQNLLPFLWINPHRFRQSCPPCGFWQLVK